MTQSATNADDVQPEPLWMVCRKGGDVQVREDLTESEQLDAITHHKLHGVEQ
jgi:hypothetical protein